MKLMTIATAQAALRDGTMTCVELITSHLQRIDAVDSQLGTVLTRLDERALVQAAAVDAKLAAGDELGVLEGIPYTAKDMFLIEGTRTTAASKILEDFIAPYTGTAIAKLEAAGAICIAKVNHDEFGHGSSTENSAYQLTHNPRQLGAVPGGSSGGSAAAVAAGIGIFSVGTDNGGSIRQPPAYCGVVGFKPTYGLVSRYGVISMASSLETVGPIATSVVDASLVLRVMAGLDPHDATTIESDLGSEVTSLEGRPDRRVGVIKEYITGLDPDIAAQYTTALGALRAAGWTVEEVSVPHIDLALPCYYILTPSEISSNLERYDGVRYGSRADSSIDLKAAYSDTRGAFFGPEVQRRILAGTYALSAGYYDAYYKKAMQVRTLIRQGYETAFGKYDILVGPITPGPAFAFGANTDNPIKMYQEDIMTVSANLAGIPAISIPIAGPDVLPLGFQMLAAQRGEAQLLATAAAAEAIFKSSLPALSEVVV